MIKIISIILITILLVIGAGVLFLSRNSDSEQEDGSVGSELPDITLKDYEGNEVRLRDLVGKPLILNSWAAWCPFCVRELPAFGEVQAEFGDEILIVAINRAESVSTARSYTDDLGVTSSMLFLLDDSDSFYKAIGGFSMPETLFFDANGIKQVHKRGPMEVEEIRERVQLLINQ